MTRNERRLEAVAYHEAGHAFMAWKEGVRIHRLSIVPDESTNGRVKHESPLKGVRLDIDNSGRARVRAEKHIRIYLAGPIAQRKHRPSSWRQWHGRSDHDEAADLIFRVTGSDEEANAYIKRLSIQTSNMLKANWPLVSRLAVAALEHRTLPWRDIKQVLASNCRT